MDPIAYTVLVNLIKLAYTEWLFIFIYLGIAKAFINSIKFLYTKYL